jgi:cytochrome c
MAACGPAPVPTSVDDAASDQAPTAPDRFGFGVTATHAEIAAWDIDVIPDGMGLPPGEGSVESGAIVFAEQCVACHGDDGREGSGGPLVSDAPQMSPPFGPRYEAWRGEQEDLPLTIGNYWPYATTLFDYIQRAMPAAQPGSLSPDEVYGLVAWLLAQNGIISEDVVMNAETLPEVSMPARNVFVPDDRSGGPHVR